jgi:hypothetical protein
MTTRQKEDDAWEALQLLNGDVFIYYGGFKEEVPMKDVFKYVSGELSRFTRLDASLIAPFKDGMIRLNRAAIAFAWYVDPNSDIVQELRKLQLNRKVR